MSDDRKDLPPVTSPNFLEKVREALSVYLGNRGDKLDRGLTVRDLADAGLVEVSARYLAGGGGRVPPIGGAGPAVAASEPDLTPPPTPTGFAAAAAISNLLLECDAPTYTQGNGHAKSVLYGATWTSGPLPVFAGAVRLTEFSGNVASYATNPASTWHLWLTWVTVDGVESEVPAGGTNGVAVTTGQDVTSMVDAMTGAGKPFTVLIAPTSIDGVTFPAGTYSTQAFIRDLQVTTAKIKELDLDNARVSKMSVAKLTAGAIDTGDITSTHTTVVGGISYPSFTINASTGLATFNNAVVRGTVYATNGQFYGTILGGVAGAYDSGVGFYSGGADGSAYRWRVGSPTGARIQWTGAAVEVYTPDNTLAFSSGTPPSSAWDDITSKPAFGIFATAPKLDAGNVSTYIAAAAIGSAQIGSIALVGTSNFSVKTATSGARMEMDSRAIKVFDASGVLRVQLGDLTA